MKKHQKNIKKHEKTHPKSSQKHQNYKNNMTQQMRTFLKKDDEKRTALHSMPYRRCLFSLGNEHFLKKQCSRGEKQSMKKHETNMSKT